MAQWPSIQVSDGIRKQQICIRDAGDQKHCWWKLFDQPSWDLVTTGDDC